MNSGKAEGERRERVTWFPVVVFNGLAESCANFLDRERLLAVQGRIQNREYEDREGVRHQVMQVVADRVTFLGAAKRDQENERRPSPGKPVPTITRLVTRTEMSHSRSRYFGYFGTGYETPKLSCSPAAATLTFGPRF
jgi:single stranded DNA-binding protein